MTSILATFDFTCTIELNRTKEQMQSIIDEFIATLIDGDLVVIFFAGHGEEENNGLYLLPTDYNPAPKPPVVGDTEVYHTLTSGAVSLNWIMMSLNNARSGLVNIIILDCCRENVNDQTFRNRVLADSDGCARSMGDSDYRPRGDGTDESTSPSSATPPNDGDGQFFIAYASDPGLQAMEVRQQRNGIFTSALLTQLRAKPEQAIHDVMIEVNEAVYTRTKGKQRPWVNNTIRKAVSFKHATQ